MAFNKVLYTDNETIISAQNLNNIQDEVIANTAAIAEKASEAQLQDIILRHNEDESVHPAIRDIALNALTKANEVQAAVENGDFDGSDGVSPTVSVSTITGGNRLTITDATGTKTVDIMDGQAGKDGAAGSPGQDGKDGQNGSDGVGIASIKQTAASTADGGDNVFTVTLTNGTSATFTVKNGSKGSAGTNGKDGASVSVSAVSESTANGGDNVVTFSDGKTLTVKNGNKGATGEKGEPGDSGVYVGSGEMPDGCNVQIDPTGEIVDLADFMNETSIPDYYAEYLAGKTKEVKALLDEAGNNAVSFVWFSDSHAEIAGIEAMNGGNTGKLAKKIMEECNIPFAISCGDSMSNSPQSTEENAEASCDLFNENVKPIVGKFYQILGNHDGAWGNELANYAGIERYTYPYNFTREKRFNRFLQKNRAAKRTKSGDDGSYFYVDDDSAKTRFICLNALDKPHEVDENGVMVPDCNTMKNGFSILQEQFDFLISALNSVEENWHVAVFSHAPFLNLYMDIDSYARKVLKAYKNKTSYSATYEGQYGGTSGGTAPDYTNLADIASSDFLIGQRLGSGGHTDVRTGVTGAYVTNYIPCAANDKVHIKQSGGTIQFAYWVKSDGSSETMIGQTADYDSSVTIYTIPNSADIVSIRFSVTNNADAQTAAESLIIAVNENIVETETEGKPCWDALNINADFTSAQGELIGLFTGHVHFDRYYPRAEYEIDMFVISCDGRVSNNPYMDAETYPEFGGRELGTVYEQCLDVVVVNKATKTVKTVRIGAGYDREFTY